jgi:uncharacterized membrane protein (DUF106 family)
MPKIDVQQRPAPPPFKFTTMIYIFLGVLSLFLMFDQTMRMTCGLFMGIALEPVIGFGGAYPHYTFLIAGVMTGVMSITIRQLTIDPIKVAETQNTMRWVNQYRMDAIKTKSQTRIKKAQELQMKYAEANFGMMKQNLKAMALTMAVILSIFAWLYMFLSYSVKYPIVSVPWSTDVHLLGSTLLPNWVLLYSLVTLPVTQAYQKVLKYLYFSKKASEEEHGVEGIE